MSGWETGSLGPPVLRVQVDLYTSGFRVTGQMSTRFRRVAEILNLTGSSHLIVEEATVTTYADPAGPRTDQTVMVSIAAILFGISTGADDAPADELRIPKRPVRTQVGVPPFWLTGMVHVPQGGRPMDGLLNVAERFLPLTDVAITSAAHPSFNHNAPVLAVQRDLAEILLIADDEAPDQLLADILPEEAVRDWLPPVEPEP